MASSTPKLDRKSMGRHQNKCRGQWLQYLVCGNLPFPPLLSPAGWSVVTTHLHSSHDRDHATSVPCARDGLALSRAATPVPGGLYAKSNQVDLLVQLVAASTESCRHTRSLTLV